MSLSASDRIDRILSGKQIHPFDWVNLPLFYDPRPQEGTEYTNRLRAGTKVAYVAANEFSYGLEFYFRPSAMSNGTLAYDLVDNCTAIQQSNISDYAERRFGRRLKTTQNLKNTVAGTELMDRVILPNRETDFRAANRVEARFADKAIGVPIEFENTPRTQRTNNALSQGATFQDWTFENWWGPRVMDAAGLIMGGNRRYESRYLGIEDLIADIVQCGFLDDVRAHVGPGKAFDIVDEEGRAVPLADRAWGRAKHIFDRTEQGYATDLAAAALIAQFAIDDWLRGNSEPVGFKLEREKIHPVLAKRSKAELDRMDRLKQMMIPYLADKCADLIPYLEDPNLKKYFEEKILPAAGKTKRDILAIHKALFTENILGDLNDGDLGTKKNKKKGMAAEFDEAAAPLFTARPAKRRSTDGHYFETPARLHDDGYFKKLAIWEQAALPFIMGAIESFRLPESAPRSLFYIAEPKGGSRAIEFMKQKGVTWLKEAYSSQDPLKDDNTFANEVIVKNHADTPQDVDNIATLPVIQRRGIKNIVSSNNFHAVAAAAEKNREFVAAYGGQKLKPLARLALMMEWLDRNPEAIAVRKDWQIHHDEVQLVMRALQISLGLVERPYEGGNYRMEIFTYDQKKKELVKQDICDLAMGLGKTVQAMLDQPAPPEAREHYLAMARMIQYIDMYRDPGRMNYESRVNPDTGAVTRREIIHWRDVDQHLLAFWSEGGEKKQALLEFCDQMRRTLLDKAVLYFNEDDLVGLHEDYTAAWNTARGFDESARRRQFGGRGTNLSHSGPV